MNIGSTHPISGKFECEAMSVVSVQVAPISAQTMEHVNKNVDQVLDYMDKASNGFPGMDLFVSPECALQGYSPDWKNVLVDLDGPEIQRLKDKCAELRVWGIFNPLVTEVDGNKYCNTAIMINDKGEIVLEYVKNNPWIPAEPTYPGGGCPVVPGPKGSRIAIIICADGDYPEIWREAAVNGANVIVRVSHYMAPWDKAWEITNKAGAYQNQVYVVSSNSVGVDEAYSYFGRSMILNPDGTIITEAPMGLPWLIKADIYPAIVDQMHKKGVTNNFLYSYNRRGSSCSEFGGKGRCLKDYNAYK
ncbi:MAG TPA: nitrilase-related carbon-nitrogen hydrolase [Clostridia bacterium]|nr:nitrilase-related carbon-nitrogen hydrolase [Thermoclostridium sp.]HZK37485.1 nitrilase-related carbon-nitrogen hydrolase [Clostridia bacterium]